MNIIKPWGKEEILQCSDYYYIKKLYLNKGHSISLQYHNHKDESWYILNGKGNVILNSKTKSFHVQNNDLIHIPKKTIHRIEAIEDIIILEISSSSNSNDIVRLEDMYGRV